jgi:phosphopentomutase
MSTSVGNAPKTAVVLVIDSFGIGALPDAELYGDEGSNTAAHVAEAVAGPKWPALGRLGLANAAALLGHRLPGCPVAAVPEASFGVMAEHSAGKDTTTGHWELAGILLDEPFATFPPEAPSFPAGLIEPFVERIGRDILGNFAASGTAIIEELGDEHLCTGRPIVYTSGDSVFQIAAHEEIIPLEELYRICEIARELCDPYRIGRVIARPFVGSSGAFTRTSGRRDFSMQPTGETILDRLVSRGVETIGIGKIGDIFCERGLSVSRHDKGNEACLRGTAEVIGSVPGGDRFFFVNLVDTDMIYGHRRDARGYCDAVSAIDDALPDLIGRLRPGDLLVITADHGCDPTFRGTDHTREYVPLLWHEVGRRGTPVGVRASFTDLAQSLCDYFAAGALEHGVSWRTAG